MVFEILFPEIFLKTLKKQPREVIDEANEKIEKLKDGKYHKQLKVHKLHGKYKDKWAMSVNHRIRIILRFSGKIIYLLDIDDHDAYK